MCKLFARIWFRATIVAFSAGLLLPPALTRAAEEETLKDVLDAWIKREVATKSVKLVIAEDHTIGKGSHGPGSPPRDFETKKKVLLVLEGVNMRHERAGETWGMGRPVHMAWSAVHEGERSKDLMITALDASGSVANKPRHMDVRSAHLAPILWHFRPLSPKFSVCEIGKLKIVSRKEMIDGSRCILVEEPTEIPGRVWRYWVATDKDMSVIRRVMVQGDVIRRQTDVTFKRDPKHGWVPTRWKSVATKNGATFSAGDITVTEYDVNGDVPDGTFDIVFPPKTKVFDRIERETYLVKPDGSKHLLEVWPPVPKKRKSDEGKLTTGL